jgi:cell division septal protein FtsQ
MLGLGRKPHRNRYERRSQARARRVKRRLEQAQRARARAGPKIALGNPTARVLATRSRAARIGLFVASLLIGTGLASTVTAGLISWWNDSPIALEAIAVQGTTRLSSDEVAAATGLARGALLEAISKPELEARVVEHPWVQDARIALLPTGTLIVDVVERVPSAVFHDGSPDAAWHFVDASGLIFANVRETERAAAATLPALARSGEPVVEGVDEVDEEAALRDGLALSSHIGTLELRGLGRADAPHRGLLLELPRGDSREGWILRGQPPGLEIVLGSENVATVVDRLDRLERLLAAGLDEIDRTTVIDMRFAGQAVLRRSDASR